MLFKKLFILCRAASFHVMHLFSFIIPKRKGLWIFVGWRKNAEREVFAENTKYFFLYTHNNLREKVRPIWIGADKKIVEILTKAGFECYSISSLKGIFYSLRAEMTIISGFLQIKNWRLSGGSKVIQLWHGKSLKKTGFMSAYAFPRYNKFTEPNLFEKPHKFVAISDYLSQYVTSDFKIPAKDILITGIPKYDALLKPEKGFEIDLDTELDILLTNIKQKKPQRIILYGPTFRPDGSNSLNVVDLIKLNEQLQKNNDYMVISLHPKFSARDWIPKDATLSHIRFSQGDKDRYPIMHKFDLLITDYSSLSIDFLFMNKPTILFAYDHKWYQKNAGIYDELWSLMPEPKVFTFETLLKILDEDIEIHNDDRTKARNKIFSTIDANASARIAKMLKVK